MNIETKCPCCGKTRIVHLTEDQARRYRDYIDGKGHIQDLLSDLSTDDREMLISGVCPICFAALAEEDEDE